MSEESSHEKSNRELGGDSFPDATTCLQADETPAHVVLYQPEIPQNTGNIARTCVATGAKLWLVHPLGFQIDEKSVRRAGCDYWDHLKLGEADSWNHLTEQLHAPKFWYFSRFARRSLWDVELGFGDAIVFGCESAGLPSSILEPDSPQAIRIPMTEHVRSLNLSNTAAIAVYEILRANRARKNAAKR